MFIVGVRNGVFEEALGLYKQAYTMHPSDKLQAKIDKLKVGFISGYIA